VAVKYSAALAATMLCLTPALAFSSSYLTRRMGKLGIRSQGEQRHGHPEDALTLTLITNPDPDPDPAPDPGHEP